MDLIKLSIRQPVSTFAMVIMVVLFGSIGLLRLPVQLTDEMMVGAVALLSEGESVYQMMQVTGEEGISMEDYLIWQKATLLDMVYLQQDAFDSVDASAPLERQKESFDLVYGLVTAGTFAWLWPAAA